jgi:hypothetical protein
MGFKKFSVKPDRSAFPELKNAEEYPKWIKATVAAMRAQDLEELLIPNYVPVTYADIQNFRAKQAFGFQVLQEKVLTPTGKAIVESHKLLFNAQGILYDLSVEATTSTHAVLANIRMMEEITLARFDPRSSKQSAVEFIVALDQKMRTYNEQQFLEDMILNDTQKKTFMQNALRSVSMLNTVHQRELERTAVDGARASFTYDQYLTVLRGVASTFDEAVAGRRAASVNKVRTSGRRSTSVNLASFGEDDDELAAESYHAEEEIQEYVAHMVKRRMKGSSMSKDTWDSLSPEGKKTWDMMSDADKKTVLQHAMERAEKEGITANTVDFAEADEEIPGEATSDDAAEGTVDVNNVTTDPKKLAHPGDARRMMSGKGKGGAKKKGQSFMVDFSKPVDDSRGRDVFALTSDGVEDVLEAYWNGNGESDSDPDFP